MQWVKPAFSKSDVDKAAVVLFDFEKYSDAFVQVSALNVFGNWRAAHSWPMNTFQVGLRRLATKIDRTALVAQRLKRVPSIFAKLKRQKNMRLSQMQDIAGCRAVLSNVKHTMALYEAYKKSRMKHALTGEKNYIANPKDSGYRGIHLVYRYNSDRSDVFNGLQVEVQLRSRLQHAWATAVETVGTFVHQSLKSSEGAEGWLSFFAHISSVFAKLEGTPPIPNVPTDDKELHAAVYKQAKEMDVVQRLRMYGTALQVLDFDQSTASKQPGYFLMVLEPQIKQVSVQPYKKAQLEQATKDYLEAEKAVSKTGKGEVVLVATDSVDSLKKAYPNYFLDTSVFLGHLEKYLESRTAPKQDE